MEKAQSRVLVVEESRATRTLLELALSEAGFQVFSAPSGNSALLQMDVVSPQVVIMAGTMAARDGGETLRRIRERSAAPILILAGTDNAGDTGCAVPGADACLPAPLDILELYAQVRALLNRGKAGRQQDHPPHTIATAANPEGGVR